MADRAQVTSVDAIEAFRADLILFLSKVRPTLEEVSNEVLRARLWLQSDQRRYWENEIKVRRQKLERAQAELFGAMLSKIKQASAAQQMAVRHAQEAVRIAESKLAMVKRWERELENRSEPLVKQVDQLHDLLTVEGPRAVAHLVQVIKTLEAYAGIMPSGVAAASEPRAEENPGGSGDQPVSKAPADASGGGGKPT